jgi:hypothetical protein
MDLLHGWKEISTYLHLTVRTAQRWEKAGLPVHRAYDSRRSPVIASVSELDFWVRSKDTGVRHRLLGLQPLWAAKLAESGSQQRRIRRQTRRLLSELNQVRSEHQRLIAHMRVSLAGTDRLSNAAAIQRQQELL